MNAMTVQLMPASDGDEERRSKLRDFLVDCRSRLTPKDVGLPITYPRRVTGLRREEIAELAGVSADWYRWFESGRPIRVSMTFLANLSNALRLTPFDRIHLYYLALPEMYEAYTEHQRTHSPLQFCQLVVEIPI